MLSADRERLAELAQAVDDGRAGALELNLVDRAAAGVENAQRRLTRVDVQSDVRYDDLDRKSVK